MHSHRHDRESGTFITSRRNYDTSLPWWGADVRTGPVRLPLIVVTYDVSPASVCRFVTGGIEDALTAAREAAGGRDVTVIAGANIGQQFFNAGLVNEIGIHLVPVLFGSGTRMVDNLGIAHTGLEVLEVVDTFTATHLRYRVLKQRAVGPSSPPGAARHGDSTPRCSYLGHRTESGCGSRITTAVSDDLRAA